MTVVIQITLEKEKIIEDLLPRIREMVQQIEGSPTAAIFIQDDGEPFLKLAHIATIGGIQWGLWEMSRRMTGSGMYGDSHEILEACKRQMLYYYRTTPLSKLLKRDTCEPKAVILEAPDNRGHYGNFTAI